jgi:hypothetical protein
VRATVYWYSVTPLTVMLFFVAVACEPVHDPAGPHRTDPVELTDDAHVTCAPLVVTSVSHG